MTGEQYLIERGLMKEGGKVLLEPVSDKTMKLVNLAQLLEEYYFIRHESEDIMSDMADYLKSKNNER